MSTHNLCSEQKCGKYQNFLSENFQFLEVKFSIHLYRHVFLMKHVQNAQIKIHPQHAKSLIWAFDLH